MREANFLNLYHQITFFQLSVHFVIIQSQMAKSDKLLKSFEVYPSIPNTSSNILALAYFQLSKFLMNSEFSKTSKECPVKPFHKVIFLG